MKKTIDDVLEFCAGWAERDFADLALAAADQVGLGLAEQDELEKTLSRVLERKRAGRGGQ